MRKTIFTNAFVRLAYLMVLIPIAIGMIPVLDLCEILRLRVRKFREMN